MEFNDWFKAIDKAFARKWGGVSLNEMVDIDYYSIWEYMKDEPIDRALWEVEDALAEADELFSWVRGDEDVD